MRNILKESKFAMQNLTIDEKDDEDVIKQDRYCLRSSPQWLAPVVETLRASMRRVITELNSANDNPMIDHRNKETLHCANFQGISISVAMDQTRQSIQLCGKLMFAQFEEMINVNMNFGLPPNLSGEDYRVNMGFKGADIAMASYQSELDSVTSPVTSHVMPAEMHNQSINSLALLSARKTRVALDILQQMLATILVAHCQALDLRWLQKKVTLSLSKAGVDKLALARCGPWYRFALLDTEEEIRRLPVDLVPVATVRTQLTDGIKALTSAVVQNKCYQEVYDNLSIGTRDIYKMVRKDLSIQFYTIEEPLGNCFQRVYETLRSRSLDAMLIKVFSVAMDAEPLPIRNSKL